MVRSSLIAGTFFALTRLMPRCGSALWRSWYDALARRDAGGQLLFMNYGYDDGSTTLNLHPSDEPFRYAIQLYARAVRGLNLSGKDILEVGCGRGGGGSYLIRYGNPRSYTGVDLSSEAISQCQRQHPFPQAKWLEGRADNIPAPTASADIVVNIESSHSYPSMPAFLQEVCRVLRPGGYFAFADIRNTGEMPELKGQLDQTGLVSVEHALITREVLRALDAMTHEREKLIDASVPPILRAAFRDFAGVRDSAVYTLLANDRLGYFCHVLQKPYLRTLSGSSDSFVGGK